MKHFLIQLTLGVSEFDLDEKEINLAKDFFKKGYLNYQENLYKLNSKYRVGVVGIVQNNSAYLSVLAVISKDLFLENENLGNAKEGDLVIVKRLLGKRGKPSAKVVEIVGRELSYSIGYIIQKEKKALVNLKNDYPIGIELSQDELDGFEVGDVFKINNQNGVIEERLGNINDPKVDEKIVLAQFNKHDKFDDDVLDMVKNFKEIDIKNYPNRVDLRDLPFCTIDPVSAKDFDDAIYWDDEAQTLYVAIADVSEYVKPFGALDREAIYRSFSIYLPHRSIPMLPRELSEKLCSLQPNKDRLSYVFEIKLDVNLEVDSSKVYEAIIHSRRRFNYDEVDILFKKGLSPACKDEEIIFDSLKKLKNITDKLRKKRLQKGYDFRSSELEMSLDENSNLLSTSLSQETPSHSLIEDCMLLANKEAAKMFDKGVFRVHEEPTQAKLQILYQELVGIGIEVEIKDELRQTIKHIQAQAKDMGIENEVDTLVIQSQMQARYSPSNLGHFGLGFERYTHFTSPIRRYSDLIVHRLLKAIIKDDKDEVDYILRNIEALCIKISEKEREASAVEFEFMDRKFTRWADKNLNKEFEAKIISTTPFVKAKEKTLGATIHITNSEHISLFDDVIIEIEKADIPKAKIYAKVIKKVKIDV